MTESKVAAFAVADVSKRFGGTQALDRVSVAFRPGEVHALVGENGAGKSTLGKVVAGVYDADQGTLTAFGESVARWDAARAQKAGIVMIAQELALATNLTVEQNVFLGREEAVGGFMRSNLAERFSRLEAMVDFELPRTETVKNLSIADQQKVEIMRALARDARVIVMDEPTSSLAGSESEKLHGLIRRLRERGTTVIYVSHFLEEVLEVADRVTVMREGQVVRTAPASDENKQTLVSGMLGREMVVNFPDRPPRIDRAVSPGLVVQNISTATGVVDASLEIRPGEVVGLLGLVGSGRSEIARAVYGADRLTGGSITLEGRTLQRRSPRRSIQQGLMFVPEDRRSQGLVLQRSVRENVSLAHTSEFSRFGWVSSRREKRSVRAIANRVTIRPPKIELPVRGFSGGNQQKALLAKALLNQPSFVILDDPTRGVDIGAKSAIYELIVELAAEGVGIILISSEHEEVLALSHRAYLVGDGKTFDEVDPEQFTAAELLYRIFNVEELEDVS